MPATRRPSHIPPGFAAVTPYITVDDPDTLVAFAKAAFAAKEMKNQHVSGSDGKTIHTAFRIEECIIETGRASGKWKALPGAIHLYVRNVDAAYARALRLAESLHEVRDMDYGERSGTVRDTCSNHWYIATYGGRRGRRAS